MIYNTPAYLQVSKLWLTLLLSLTLTACATTTNTIPETTPPQTSEQQKQLLWEQQQKELRNIQSWQLRGKIGVRTGPKGGSATLKWQYDANNQDIELYGPFGSGRVIITVAEDGAELKDTKGNILVGETASDVLYQRLGWHVPFNQLAQWARGLSGETATDILINDQGRLESFTQDSWQIKYQRFEVIETSANTMIALPTKFTISAVPGSVEIYSSKGKYLGDELSVKIIIKRWRDIQAETN